MKKYTTKSKLFGYKIGLNNDNLFVAVPKKYFANGQSVEVKCEDETKIVIESDKVSETTQKDKYTGEMNYTIYYFLWKEY